jgi:hypothetical protein
MKLIIKVTLKDGTETKASVKFKDVDNFNTSSMFRANDILQGEAMQQYLASFALIAEGNIKTSEVPDIDLDK